MLIKTNNIIFLLTSLCLILAQQLYSQEVRGVEGRWPIVNITPEQAREKAIEEAQKEALLKAGVSIRIRAAEVLSQSETNERNEQMFSMFSNIELSGAVTSYDIVRDEREISNIDGLIYAVVTINATVKKYATNPDPEFKIDVQGLRTNGYRNGESINFSVHPNKDGYLKIFLFENTEEAMQVFPNDFEQKRKLTAKEIVHFPTLSGIVYTAEKTVASRQQHNMLLFVYTKSDIPFYGTVNCRRVLEWINQIEPNDREVIVEPLLITE